MILALLLPVVPDFVDEPVVKKKLWSAGGIFRFHCAADSDMYFIVEEQTNLLFKIREASRGCS